MDSDDEDIDPALLALAAQAAAAQDTGSCGTSHAPTVRPRPRHVSGIQACGADSAAEKLSTGQHSGRVRQMNTGQPTTRSPAELVGPIQTLHHTDSAIDRIASTKWQMLCQAKCSGDLAAHETVIHGAVDNLVNIASAKTAGLTDVQKLA